MLFLCVDVLCKSLKNIYINPYASIPVILAEFISFVSEYLPDN